MTIRINPRPLPPMRDGKQIVIDSMAAIRGGVDLHDGHVRGLVEPGNPAALSRACEAIAIMAHMLNPKRKAAPPAIPQVKAVERLSQVQAVLATARIMAAIRDERERAQAAGRVFTVADIQPILEKALGA